MGPHWPAYLPSYGVILWDESLALPEGGLKGRLQCIPEGVSDGDHRVRGNNFVQQLPVLSPPRGQDVIESDVVVGVSLNKEVLTIEGTD